MRLAFTWHGLMGCCGLRASRSMSNDIVVFPCGTKVRVLMLDMLQSFITPVVSLSSIFLSSSVVIEKPLESTLTGRFSALNDTVDIDELNFTSNRVSDAVSFWLSVLSGVRTILTTALL